MTPEQRDVIAAGIAVRGWPQPYNIYPRPWEDSNFVMWVWPAHPSCPPEHRNKETGEAQDIYCGVVVREDATAEDIAERFADIDGSFAFWRFNPVTGTFHKGM